MTTFIREDGCELQVIAGFRNRVLSYRPSVTPRSHWNDDDYVRAIKKRVNRGKRLIKEITHWHGSLKNAEILEIGCGDGLNTILLGLQAVKRVVGIDIDPRLNKQNEQGECLRRLADGVIKALDVGMSLDQCLSSLPVELLTMDTSQLKFPDNSFDLLLSRSVLEHIHPVEKVFAEISRVVRPQGMIYHTIDPFYWLRGCHKRGLVDIPWAHSRLPLHEFHRFVTESEGKRTAGKRLKRLKTLNRRSLKQWKLLMENDSFEIVNWNESTSSFAETVLDEYPEIGSTLLPGIEPRDLLVSRIEVWLRNQA